LTEDIEKRPRGRPSGTSENPTDLIRKDLQQTLKLNTRLRTMAEGQLGWIAERLEAAKAEGNEEKVLKFLEALTRLNDNLMKGVRETAKFVFTTEAQKSAAIGAREDQGLLDELRGGGG
jgi:hypothetical protein